MRCPLCNLLLPPGEDLPSHYLQNCVQSSVRSAKQLRATSSSALASTTASTSAQPVTPSVVLRWAPFTTVLDREVHLFAAKKVNGGQPVVLKRQLGGDYQSDAIPIEPGVYEDCQLVVGSDVHTTQAITIFEHTQSTYILLKDQGKAPDTLRGRTYSGTRLSTRSSGTGSSMYSELLLHQIQLGDSEKITRDILSVSQEEHERRQKEKAGRNLSGAERTVQRIADGDSFEPDSAVERHLVPATSRSGGLMSKVMAPAGPSLHRAKPTSTVAGHKGPRSSAPLKASHLQTSRPTPAGSSNSLLVQPTADYRSFPHASTAQSHLHSSLGPAEISSLPSTHTSRHVRSRSADNALAASVAEMRAQNNMASVLAPSFSRQPQNCPPGQGSSPPTIRRHVPGSAAPSSTQTVTTSTSSQPSVAAQLEVTKIRSPLVSEVATAPATVVLAKSAEKSGQTVSEKRKETAQSSTANRQSKEIHTVTVEAIHFLPEGRHVPVAVSSGGQRPARPSSAPLTGRPKAGSSSAQDGFIWRPEEAEDRLALKGKLPRKELSSADQILARHSQQAVASRLNFAQPSQALTGGKSAVVTTQVSSGTEALLSSRQASSVSHVTPSNGSSAVSPLKKETQDRGDEERMTNSRAHEQPSLANAKEADVGKPSSVFQSVRAAPSTEIAQVPGVTPLQEPVSADEVDMTDHSSSSYTSHKSSTESDTDSDEESDKNTQPTSNQVADERPAGAHSAEDNPGQDENLRERCRQLEQNLQRQNDHFQSLIRQRDRIIEQFQKRSENASNNPAGERVAQLEAQVSRLKQTLGVVQGENAQLANENKHLARENAAASRSDARVVELESELAACKESASSNIQTAQLESELATAQETVRLQSEQISELQLNLATADLSVSQAGLTSVQEQKRLHALEEQLKACKTDMQLLVEEKRELVERNKVVETEGQQANQLLREFAERSEQEQQERQHLELQIRQLSQQVASAQKQANHAAQLEDELLSTREQLSTLTVEHSELQGVAQAREQQLHQLGKRLTEMEGVLHERDALRQQHHAAEEQLVQMEALVREVEAERQRAETMEEEHAVLRAQVASLQEALETKTRTMKRYRDERNAARKQVEEVGLTTVPVRPQTLATNIYGVQPGLSHYTTRDQRSMAADVSSQATRVETAVQPIPGQTTQPAAGSSSRGRERRHHRSSSGSKQQNITADQGWVPPHSTGDADLVHISSLPPDITSTRQDSAGQPVHNILVSRAGAASTTAPGSMVEATTRDHRSTGKRSPLGLEKAGSKAQHIRCGDFVQVKRRGGEKQFGTVLYIGDMFGKNGTYVGVELLQKNGKHDGTVDRYRYFSCKAGHGLMVAIDKVEPLGMS